MRPGTEDSREQTGVAPGLAGFAASGVRHEARDPANTHRVGAGPRGGIGGGGVDWGSQALFRERRWGNSSGRSSGQREQHRRGGRENRRVKVTASESGESRGPAGFGLEQGRQ